MEPTVDGPSRLEKEITCEARDAGIEIALQRPEADGLLTPRPARSLD